MDDAQLRTIWQQRQSNFRPARLDEPLAFLMKHTLAKKAKQLGALAGAWDEVIPDEISEHTALESFNRGVLTVIVDSAPHRFQLQTLLNGGLLRALQERFSAAINKVRLVPGQFSAIDLAGVARYHF